MIRQQKASKLSFIILYSFLFNLDYILLQLGYTHMVCMCLNCSSEFSKMLRYLYFQILNKYNHLRMIKIQLRMKGRNSKVEISPLCLPSFPPPIFLLFYGSCKHLLETYLISKNEVRRRQTWPLSLAHLQNLHDKQRNPADLRKSEGY